MYFDAFAYTSKIQDNIPLDLYELQVLMHNLMLIASDPDKNTTERVLAVASLELLRREKDIKM